MGYQPLFEITRGGVVESVHHGAIAVVDARGRLLASYGDPQTITYLRSSAKPFQALPLVASGAAARLALTDEQLAVICASHAGTEAHLRVVASIQAAIGVTEKDLQCGTHPPFDPASAARLAEAGLQPGENHHNCSGKHSGMLALAKDLQAPIEDYLELSHPVQSRILDLFARMCDLEPQQVAIGIDGCSAPNFAVPLRSAAAAYARLADPADLEEPLAAACRTVMLAMGSHPLLVSGPGRFDTRLMETLQGSLVIKGGAEGYAGLAMPVGARGPGSPALGVAIKIADGDHARRAGSSVVLAVLEMLGMLSAEQSAELADFHHRPVLNHRKTQVGEERSCFQLEWAQGAQDEHAPG